MKAIKRWAGCDLWKAVETLDMIEFYQSITKAGQVSAVKIIAHVVLKCYKNLHNHIRKHPLVYQRLDIVSTFRLLTGLLELNTKNLRLRLRPITMGSMVICTLFGRHYITWHYLVSLGITLKLDITWYNLWWTPNQIGCWADNHLLWWGEWNCAYGLIA